ncbi:CMD domain-containing protein [Streptomyces boluensis]|uniref:CMD domain-containing protein n=1 Tax=Streptomyces boluensis TaxID=1775135 RepID=UPI0028B0EC2A|nr:peroxidase-related enzyme [Streptomyces boluensis]
MNPRQPYESYESDELHEKGPAVPSVSHDVIDSVTGAPDAVRALRGARDKAYAHTQAAHDVLLAASSGLSRAARSELAAHVAELEGAPALAAHYRGLRAGGALPTGFDALRAHARRLVLAPSSAGPEHIAELAAAGFAPRDIVSASQLAAFVTYQTRLAAGLRALAGLAAESGELPAYEVPVLEREFTLGTLDWDAWVETLRLEDGTPEQLAVLEESLPTAKTSAYYLALVHDVEALRERSRLYNAIMYAPRGLDRRDREIAALAVSRVNGCVYCASVHARRFAQLNKDAGPAEAILGGDLRGDTPRRQAIVDFAVALTARTGRPLPVRELREVAGLDDTEILDLIHVVAVFAWANRLMLTLGAPAPAPEEREEYVA